MVNDDRMNINILTGMRSVLLERTSIDALPAPIWKRTSALNTWGTNAIEGSTISYKDAEKILFDDLTPKGKSASDVTITLQHEHAFRRLLARRKKEITLESVLELHEDVFRLVLPDAGQWRRSNVRVRGAKYSPPRMEKVLREMESWITEYRKRDIAGNDAFKLAAWMHFS